MDGQSSPAGALPRLDAGNLPRHIGIIMDGNGRWAVLRGKTRTAGHQEGLTAAKRVVTAAVDLGIPFVSLYVFSTENWKRDTTEVSFLMGLIALHLRKELDFYRKNEIRVVHSGDASSLPPEVASELSDIADLTASFHKTTLNLCINYGGRDEIVRAVNRRLALSAVPVTEGGIRASLDQPELPDVDLVIRTAGERRLSNFLLWQCSYAEYLFSDKLWPDFSAEDLEAAVRDYASRVRKYGGLPRV